ncbi:MAG: FGGY-family carbohydrate kinase [Acidimicrobiales bacterium]
MAPRWPPDHRPRRGTGPLAASVDDTGGVVFVPALAGLGSPYWDRGPGGTIIGLTRGTGRAEIVRATVEAIAFQSRDVIEAMATASGTGIADLRVDGGASVMDLLLQIQADQLGVPVTRASVAETTALGAAVPRWHRRGRLGRNRRRCRQLARRRHVPTDGGSDSGRCGLRPLAARRHPVARLGPRGVSPLSRAW